MIDLRDNKPLLSQRLNNGDLVFWAKDIPSYGHAQFRVANTNDSANEGTACSIEGNKLCNEFLQVEIDEETGDIITLKNKKSGRNFVDQDSNCALNSFRYLHGDDRDNASAGPQYAGPQYANPGNQTTGDATKEMVATGPTNVKISAGENGPLIVSLIIESDAEGCNKLTREIRLLAGQDHIEISNTVDKVAIREKEGIHFGFAFDIPNSRTHMDIPWGIMEMEVDQIPASNRNWMCFQRWLDISNTEYGITLCSLDAPTVESGKMTANIIGSATESPEWIRNLEPSSTIYSWALNNHWHTNFPQTQEGEIRFRYRVQPHESSYCSVQSNQFGMEQAQPLVVTKSKVGISTNPKFSLNNPKVYISSLKTSADGTSLDIRLRSISDQKEKTNLSSSLLKEGVSVELDPFEIKKISIPS